MTTAVSLPRRTFLATSAASAAAACGQTPPLPTPAGKDQRLGILSSNPLVLETPDALLGAQRITPAAALFVRQHHGATAFNDMNPRPLAGWTLEVVGLARSGREADAASFAALPQVDVEMVLQCSGNFRKRFSAIAPIKGTPWSAGGVGNVVFGGVRLKDALTAMNIEIAPAARFLAAEGRDQPERREQADFEHSLPLDEALEHAVLATRLNGQPLPAVHGGPLRLVMPGYYATMQVKWLHRLRLESGASTTHYQTKDYRVPLRPVAPGAAFAFTETNSRPNYGMNINSRIFAPSPGTVPGGAVAVAGVAWNDGRAPLESVHVSADRGQTWQRAALADSAGPFAWQEWRASVALAAGAHELWSRATDAEGRTQPLDGAPHWNPGGYEWNAVDRLAVVVA